MKHKEEPGPRHASRAYAEETLSKGEASVRVSVAGWKCLKRAAAPVLWMCGPTRRVCCKKKTSGRAGERLLCPAAREGVSWARHFLHSSVSGAAYCRAPRRGVYPQERRG